MNFRSSVEAAATAFGGVWMVDHSLSTSLDLLGLSKAADGRAEDSCRVGGKDVGAAGHRLLAGLAGPDADAGALHRLLKSREIVVRIRVRFWIYDHQIIRI